MAVTIEDFKNQINADDDEDIQGFLDYARDYVRLYVAQDIGEFSEPRQTQVESLLDNATLQVATFYYLHRDGQPDKNIRPVSSSLDTLMNYTRNFSV